jgi:hypothetical protein
MNAGCSRMVCDEQDIHIVRGAVQDVFLFPANLVDIPRQERQLSDEVAQFTAFLGKEVTVHIVAVQDRELLGVTHFDLPSRVGMWPFGTLWRSALPYQAPGGAGRTVVSELLCIAQRGRLRTMNRNGRRRRWRPYRTLTR